MVSSRFIVRQSVDLPEPDGPMTTTTSPRPTVRSMSWRTCNVPEVLVDVTQLDQRIDGHTLSCPLSLCRGQRKLSSPVRDFTLDTHE